MTVVSRRKKLRLFSLRLRAVTSSFKLCCMVVDSYNKSQGREKQELFTFWFWFVFWMWVCWIFAPIFNNWWCLFPVFFFHLFFNCFSTERRKEKRVEKEEKRRQCHVGLMYFCTLREAQGAVSSFNIRLMDSKRRKEKTVSRRSDVLYGRHKVLCPVLTSD